MSQFSLAHPVAITVVSLQCQGFILACVCVCACDNYSPLLCTDTETDIDFVGLDNAVEVFSNGDVRRCRTVSIIEDNITEVDEVFSVVLSATSFSPVIISPNTSKEITIVNEDGKFQMYYVNENYH